MKGIRQEPELEQECGICYQSRDDNNQPIVFIFTPCKHKYCPPCYRNITSNINPELRKCSFCRVSGLPRHPNPNPIFSGELGIERYTDLQVIYGPNESNESNEPNESNESNQFNESNEPNESNQFNEPTFHNYDLNHLLYQSPPRTTSQICPSVNRKRRTSRLTMSDVWRIQPFSDLF